MDTLKIRIDNLTDSQAMDIVGTADRNLNVLGECLNCEISYRDQVFFLRSAKPQTEQKARAVLKASGGKRRRYFLCGFQFTGCRQNTFR